MNIINLTPHTLNIHSAGALVAVVEPAGQVARCASTRTLTGVREGIEFFETVFGAPSPLPDAEPDDIFVVSSLYLAGLRAAGLDDPRVHVPGEAVRDADGKVVGCQGLSR